MKAPKTAGQPVNTLTSTYNSRYHFLTDKYHALSITFSSGRRDAAMFIFGGTLGRALDDVSRRRGDQQHYAQLRVFAFSTFVREFSPF